MYKKINVHPLIKIKHDDLFEQPVIIRVRRFSESSCEIFTDQIDKAVNSGQPFIPIVIDSYGGQVYSLLEMIQKMQHCGLPCHTIVEGKAMSCGAILFAMGNQRYMSPHATLMLHEVSSNSFGKIEEIKADAKETDRLNKLLFKLMAENCKKKYDFFLKLVHNRNHADCYITATEAKKLNICTDIGIPTFKIDVSLKFSLEKFVNKY